VTAPSTGPVPAADSADGTEAAHPPGQQPPPGPPERTETGHPAVDAALRALEEAAAVPPDGQVAAFQAAHRTLRETLATIDDA
jgi:hypothetical protein